MLTLKRLFLKNPLLIRKRLQFQMYENTSKPSCKQTESIFGDALHSDYGTAIACGNENPGDLEAITVGDITRHNSSQREGK